MHLSCYKFGERLGKGLANVNIRQAFTFLYKLIKLIVMNDGEDIKNRAS